MAVVLVLEGIQIEAGRGLVHRLEHEAKAAVVIIYIIGIQILTSVHGTLQQLLSLLVGKGVLHLPVLIRGLGHTERTLGIVAVVYQYIGTAYRVADAVQGSGGGVQQVIKKSLPFFVDKDSL